MGLAMQRVVHGAVNPLALVDVATGDGSHGNESPALSERTAGALYRKEGGG